MKKILLIFLFLLLLTTNLFAVNNILLCNIDSDTSFRPSGYCSIPSLTRIGAITLLSPEDQLQTAVTDGTYAYFFGGDYADVNTITKIRLSDFTNVASVTTPADRRYIWNAAIDPSGEYIYYVNGAGISKITKIKASDLSEVSTLTLTYPEVPAIAMVADFNNDYLYVATQYDQDNSWLVKINISTFSRIDAINLQHDIVLGTDGKKYYCRYTNHISAENNKPITGANWSSYWSLYYGSLSADTWQSGIWYNMTVVVNRHSLIIDSSHNNLFLIMEGTTPSNMMRVSLSPFQKNGILILNSGEEDVKESIVDNNNIAYLASYTSPSRIIKVNLDTFSRVGAITLATGENGVSSMSVGNINQNLFCGTETSPGKVVRINLENFTKVETLTLNAGENILTASAIDAANQFVYFGTKITAPAYIIKLDICGD